MKKKNVMVVVMLLVLSCILTACGSKDSSEYSASDSVAYSEEYYDDSYSNGFSTESYEYDSGDMATETTEEASSKEYEELDDSARKLIKTVYLDLETKTYDEVLSFIELRVDYVGGYMENFNNNTGSIYTYKTTKYASLKARIPADRVDDFVEEIGEMANVTSHTESVEDITLTYVDLDSHIKTLEVEEESLLALLEKAETVEDIITVESRLSDIRYQLESLNSQLRTYDNLVSYATVYITLDEVEELTPVEELSTGEKIVQGFTESLKSVGNGFRDFFVWFIVNIPHLVVWAVIIVAFVFFIRFCIKFSNKKHEKKMKKMEETRRAEEARRMEEAKRMEEARRAEEANKQD